ncbi:MAG: hypothetical protein ACOZQL_18020 [Myxococcota bacterium]
MTRPTRNWLIVALLIAGAFTLGPRLPDAVTWVAPLVAAPLIGLALWVTAPFHRARSLLARRSFDEAATELAAFEKALTESKWKRALASLAVGLHTTQPLAAARNTLGAVRLEQGRLDDARTHFMAALQHDPGYGVPWGNLAVLAAMKGDRAAADAARRKAAERGFSPRLLSRVLEDKLAGR